MISHEKGTLIILSIGAYSDYYFNGLYRALVDIDLGDEAQRYYDQCPINEFRKHKRDASDSGFAEWLITNGMVEEVDFDEINCGVCFDFDFDTHGIAEQCNQRALAIGEIPAAKEALL